MASPCYDLQHAIEKFQFHRHPAKGRTIRKVMGGGGERAKYKKIFAQGKIKWKKIHARQLILKNIHALA